MDILVITCDPKNGMPNTIFVHEQVKAFHKLGHHVRVISFLAIGKAGYTSKHFGLNVVRHVAEGIPIFYIRFFSLSRFGQYGFNSVSAYYALLYAYNTVFSDFKPDIIHAHKIDFEGSIAVRLGAEMAVPVVVTTHGSDAMRPIACGKSQYIKRVCDLANHVVCVSSMLLSQLQQIGIKGNISVIRNGCSVENIKSAEKRALSFIQVSNLIKQKNADITIKAFAQISAVYPLASLAIIGSGPEESALRNLAAELGITDRVCFLGQIENELVLQKMAETEFFVMPSVREGFGIVYIEAMASGCVTIGTQGEGISDLMISGENGILVPPNDVGAIVKEVLRCIEDKAYAASLATAGREVALSLTWAKNATQYLSLFQGLLD